MQQSEQNIASWLERAMVEFIGYCRQENRLPSDFALLEFLGVDVPTLKDLRQQPGCAPAFDRLQLYREHRLLQQLEESKSNATGIVFQLKQVKNGGYQDHGPTGTEGSAFLLQIDGVGGTEAFG